MYRDPLIRSYNESPPYVGGRRQVRYSWPEFNCEYVAKIRDQVQRCGEALYVLWDPLLKCHVVLEAMYADQFWNEEYRRGDHFDPYQRDDFRRGGLVVLEGYPASQESDKNRWLISEPDALNVHVLEIRRNNRSARIHLKQTATKSYHRQDMANEKQREEEEFENWAFDLGMDLQDEMRYAGLEKLSTYVKEKSDGQTDQARSQSSLEVSGSATTS